MSKKIREPSEKFDKEKVYPKHPAAHPKSKRIRLIDELNPGILAG